MTTTTTITIATSEFADIHDHIARFAAVAGQALAEIDELDGDDEHQHLSLETRAAIARDIYADLRRRLA